MWSLVENHRAGLGAQLLEDALTLLLVRLFRRQEGLEGEATGRKPGDREGGDGCDRSRQRGDGDAGLDGLPDELLPRIGNARRAGVRDDRDVFPGEHILHQRPGLVVFIKFMVRRHRRFDLEMI